MTITSTSDVFVLTLGVVLAALYLFRDQLFVASKPKSIPITTSARVIAGDENPRDFIAKMKAGVSSLFKKTD
jgi:NADPH-ferrihemoprotein reductase